MLFFPTVDEDVAYFRSQGYTGSINDMHYKALGDLNHTGALSDRIHSFLVSEYGSFYESMRNLRNGSASFVALRYGVGTKQPALTLDFIREYFRTGGSKTTLGSAVTHAATTNATMVDSTGEIKWRPHNLLTYSEDVTSNSYLDFGNTGNVTFVDATTITFGAGIANVSNKTLETTNLVGQQITGAIELSSQTHAGEVVQLRLNWRGGSSVNGSPYTLTTTPTLVYVTGTVPAGATGVDLIVYHPASEYVEKTFTATKWHLYRSDLGGMVNNPETGDSYVPTTSTARYLPRVGHHVYNGTSWVNEGLLHESEARTNLLLNSGTLSTQSATVAAVPNTLSFTGTGTVTLTGASTAGPLVGTGTGENNRVVLTFTPTAGTLTLTVSGTVTNAQLEASATPSSYIPTTGSTATRAAETMTVPAANMPWPDAVNPLAVSIQMDGRMTYADTDGYGLVQFHRWERDSSNRIYKSIDGFGTNIGKPVTVMTVLGVTDYSIGDADHYSPGINVPFNYADRYGSTFVNSALEGTALTANTTPVGLPDLSDSDLTLGKTFMGTIGSFRVWADDLGDAGLVEATSPSLEPSLSLTFDGSQTSFTVSDWSE